MSKQFTNRDQTLAHIGSWTNEVTGDCTGTTLVGKQSSEHYTNCTRSQQAEEITKVGKVKIKPTPNLSIQHQQHQTRELLEFVAKFEKQDPWSVYRKP